MSKELWNKCIEFHGHQCGGLMIGYKAALYAKELMGFEINDNEISKDEELVCITENDACSVDAIQVGLGCSIGKGNLLFHMTGKQAYSFYNKNTGKSFRLVLKKRPENMTKKESFAYFEQLEPQNIFDVKDATIVIPESAKLFNSYECSLCHEETGENWIRVVNGEKVCKDCYQEYSRFSL